NGGPRAGSGGRALLKRSGQAPSALLGGGRGLGRLCFRQRAHWQRNNISGFRDALLPALAEPSQRRIDEQGIAVDMLDQQAILALEMGLEAMLQGVGALP